MTEPVSVPGNLARLLQLPNASNTFYPAGRTGTDGLSRHMTLFTGADPSSSYLGLTAYLCLGTPEWTHLMPLQVKPQVLTDRSMAPQMIGLIRAQVVASE